MCLSQNIFCWYILSHTHNSAPCLWGPTRPKQLSKVQVSLEALSLFDTHTHTQTHSQQSNKWKESWISNKSIEIFGRVPGHSLWDHSKQIYHLPSGHSCHICRGIYPLNIKQCFLYKVVIASLIMKHDCFFSCLYCNFALLSSPFFPMSALSPKTHYHFMLCLYLTVNILHHAMFARQLHSYTILRIELYWVTPTKAKQDWGKKERHGDLFVFYYTGITVTCRMIVWPCSDS